MAAFQIQSTREDDLDFIAQMFDEAITYQIRNNYPVWKGHNKLFIQRDLDAKRQYKIVKDGKIACVFSIFHSDPIIWGEKDDGLAIYLNRVVINPNYKGNRLFGLVLDWTEVYARQKERRFIRMDTWANNPDIISYFKSFGFGVTERVKAPKSPDLPAPYWDIDVVLLEKQVGD